MCYIVPLCGVLTTLHFVEIQRRARAAMTPLRMAELSELYRRSLLEDVVPFWQRHGVDREYGGFLTCLERDGSVYSTDKSVWFQGRAAWLYAALYRQVEPRPEWLELARHGCDFLDRHCFDRSGKMYFTVDRQGRPLRMRRYVFSEVFAVLAFTELARATRDPVLRERAIGLFDRLVRNLREPGKLAAKTNPQTRPMKGLSPLMCLISVADGIQALAPSAATEAIITDAIEEILRDFVRPEDESILETVAPDGTRLDTLEGRVMNPGHAIESAWFIMEIARRRKDARLLGEALRILNWAMARGWDNQHGGLLYFVDVAGKPSPYLEHDMKLWWPHSEALYAALLAYRLTGDARYSEMYERLHGYVFSHFPDPQHGEWFGYLRRDGAVSLSLKGNLWKGPFHVPRALLLCWKLLETTVDPLRP
jgi:N-acylglucosamine 2-epimerase